MPKKPKTKGISTRILGYSVRLKTPLSIFSAMFVVGIVVDLFMEILARNIEQLQGRIYVGFRFWWLYDSEETSTCINTGDELHNVLNTLTIDDFLLLLMTFAILLLWKLKWKLRVIAALGFFAGWYVSSSIFSARWGWYNRVFPPDEQTKTEMTEAMAERVLAAPQETDNPLQVNY